MNIITPVSEIISGDPENTYYQLNGRLGKDFLETIRRSTQPACLVIDGEDKARETHPRYVSRRKKYAKMGMNNKLVGSMAW